MRHFDLNIDTILEAWTVADALREVIANALDEQAITGTAEVEITEEGGAWRVRDYGRGLRVEHLTQNENEEKLQAEGIIGKFGVGLKDALATLDRRDVGVTIRSSHGTFTPARASKHGFEDLVTLHVGVAPPPTGFVGTEFAFDGLRREDLEAAKAYFLRFSDERELEETRYGQVLERAPTGPARIYVNGVRVAEEEDMLFSYNVTSLTAPMRKAMNRERTHVGRSAYSDRLKAMLLGCQSYMVATRLVADLERYASGENHEELKWIDVQAHACRLLNEGEDVVFVTAAELEERPDSAYRAKQDGHRVVVVPEALRSKIHGERDASGRLVRTVEQYEVEYNDSFEYDFIDEGDMTPDERRVWGLCDSIVAAAGGCRRVREIRVSNTMRLEGGFIAVGQWSPMEGRIIVRRDQLRSPDTFAGILLHELAHARSGAKDMTREFENELTGLLGTFASRWAATSTTS